jgi:hypothetical protein
MLIRPLPLLAAFAVGVARASPILVKRLFPDPEPCKGNCSWVHDPNVYVEGGTYWRFSTSGNIAVASADDLRGPWRYQGALLEEGTSIVVDGGKQDVWVCSPFSPPLSLLPSLFAICNLIWPSTCSCIASLEMAPELGRSNAALHRLSSTLNSNRTFPPLTSPQAPNIFKIDDTFYCYYSVSYLGSQASQIGFATSKSLEVGSWTDHGSLNIAQSPSYNLIDPAIFQETPESPVHMTFGSYWDGIFSLQLPSEALVYKRNEAALKRDAPPSTKDGIPLNRNATGTGPTSWTSATSNLNNLIRNTTSNPDVVEGAFMYAHAGSYYLFFSAGNCCATPPNLAPAGHEYRILVCKAASPEGPFIDRDGRRCDESGGTLVLGSHGDVYAPGGQGVIFDEKTGRTAMYYHYGESVLP